MPGVGIILSSMIGFSDEVETELSATSQEGVDKINSLVAEFFAEALEASNGTYDVANDDKGLGNLKAFLSEPPGVMLSVTGTDAILLLVRRKSGQGVEIVGAYVLPPTMH